MIFDDEQGQSTGFPDAISDGIFAVLSAVLVGAVAVMVWAITAGVLWI